MPANDKGTNEAKKGIPRKSVSFKDDNLTPKKAKFDEDAPLFSTQQIKAYNDSTTPLTLPQLDISPIAPNVNRLIPTPNENDEDSATDQEDNGEDPEVIAATQGEDLNRSASNSPILNFGQVGSHDRFLKQRDYDPEFILKAWRLSEQQNYIAYASILAETSTPASVNDLIDFLGTHPEKKFGLFPLALMLLDMTKSFSIHQILDLYSKWNFSVRELTPILQKLTVFYINCELIRTCSLSCLGMLNHSLRDLVNVDIQQIFEMKKITDDKRKGLITLTGSQCLIDLMKLIGDLIWTKHCTMERAEAWNLLLHEYMKDFGSGNGCNIFETLLFVDLKRNKQTSIFLYVKDDQLSIPICFHDGVVNRFTLRPIKSEEAVEATSKECDFFTTLLYRKYKPDAFKGKITEAVYKIAKIINIQDISWFLFRGNSYVELMDNANNMDILKIALLLENEENLDEIAKNFMTLFSDSTRRSKSLNELNAEQVVNFLDRTCLKVPELEVYKMVIQWSHHACGKECQDELKAISDDVVHSYFLKVRRVIRVSSLTSSFNELWGRGFINCEDFETAMQATDGMYVGIIKLTLQINSTYYKSNKEHFLDHLQVGGQRVVFHQTTNLTYKMLLLINLIKC